MNIICTLGGRATFFLISDLSRDDEVKGGRAKYVWTNDLHSLSSSCTQSEWMNERGDEEPDKFSVSLFVIFIYFFFILILFIFTFLFLWHWSLCHWHASLRSLLVCSHFLETKTIKNLLKCVTNEPTKYKKDIEMEVSCGIL